MKNKNCTSNLRKLNSCHACSGVRHRCRERVGLESATLERVSEATQVSRVAAQSMTIASHSEWVWNNTSY